MSEGESLSRIVADSNLEVFNVDELHDDIDILRKAQISMRIHRQTASHDVAHAGALQRGDNLREACEFHYSRL
jgi:hypothetical protein